MRRRRRRGALADDASPPRVRRYFVGSGCYVAGTALFSRPPVPAAPLVDAAAAGRGGRGGGRGRRGRARKLVNLGPFGAWYVANVGERVVRWADARSPTFDADLTGDVLFIVGSVLFGVAAFASGGRRGGRRRRVPAAPRAPAPAARPAARARCAGARRSRARRCTSSARSRSWSARSGISRPSGSPPT